MAYDVMLSQTPQALRTPVVWRLPGCGGGKTALFCGAAQTLGAELQALGARHIFLVIGRHAARTDTKAVILNSLRASGITWDVYSEIPAEPHLEDALQMAEAMKGARYDAVVGVGGGVAVAAGISGGLLRRGVLCRLRGAGAEGQKHGNHKEQCDMFFHLVILPFLICFEQLFRPDTVHKLYLA